MGDGNIIERKDSYSNGGGSEEINEGLSPLHIITCANFLLLLASDNEMPLTQDP